MPTLEFKGKQFVHSHHLSVPFRALEVEAGKSLSKKPGLDDNLIIHGDNLHALKALLPKYAGKVKCIYIDPPYNTGNEGWCYNDNVNSPQMKEWLAKSANPVDKEDLLRHDKWLCMMWPRLQLLRELLADDGVIFISIDDNEYAHLKVVMDEIFGEDRHVATLSVINNLKGRNDKANVATSHEYMLIYANPSFSAKGLPLSEEQLKEYKYTDSKNEKYALRDLRKRGRPDRREDRPNMFFPIYYNEAGNTVSLERTSKDDIEITPKRGDGSDGRWRWGKEKVKNNLHILHAKRSDKKGRWDISHRVYLNPNAAIEINGDEEVDDDDFLYERTSKSKSFWWGGEISTDVGRRELKRIFEDLEFEYPKSPFFIERILHIATEKNSIILDSFAGSGTTAHAVLALNKEDGGNRKFILVEMEDYADSVTAERVRRVIKGVPAAKDDALKQGLGGSFTFARLGEPFDIDKILTGESLPNYNALAHYVFYTATGESLDKDLKPAANYFIGETALFEVYLIYKDDLAYLRSNDSALNQEKLDIIGAKKSKKQKLVFATAKYMSQTALNEHKVVFCQIPFAIHKLAGN